MYHTGYAVADAAETLTSLEYVWSPNEAWFCHNRPVSEAPTSLRDGDRSMSNYDNDSSESSGEFVCPWDGCDYTTEHERGLKIHHSHVHGESIATQTRKVTVNCDNCGDKTKKKLGVLERTEHNFCGEGCWGSFYDENMQGEDHPHYIETDDLECEWCGDKYRKRPSETDKSKYCSKECYHKALSDRMSGSTNPAHSARMSGDTNPNWKPRESVKCKNCDEIFETKPHMAERRVFCSRQCHHDYMVRENHPRWDGGYELPGFGKEWVVARKKRLELDGHECQICGMGPEEHREKFTHDIEVHHIIPRDQFRDSNGDIDFEKAHDLDNLITMCREHHVKWEGVPLRPQREVSDGL